MKWKNNTLQAGAHQFQLALDEHGTWGFTVTGPSEGACWGYSSLEEAKARAEALAKRMLRNEQWVFSL